MKRIIFASIFSFFFGPELYAGGLQPDRSAPSFTLKNQAGKEFKLESRRGKWTVLYFYPKSETPGCTKQACAFRDGLAKIRKLGAEVYGVSVNSVQDQSKFHQHHHLNFDVLADENGEVTELYGVKMPIVKMAKRWTFLIDPELKIRAIDKDVDPVKDPDHVVENLKKLQEKAATPKSA